MILHIFVEDYPSLDFLWPLILQGETVFFENFVSV